MRLIVLNYGGGNLKSVVQALQFLGYDSKISRDPKEIADASCIIFPGQGAFGSAMSYLSQYHLIAPLKAHIANHKPFIGICLGFQVLFEGSEENGGQEGLGLFPGKLVRFSDQNQKVPHMGWNTLQIIPSATFFTEPSPYCYFVHSYFLPQTRDDLIFSTTTYSTPFVSGIYTSHLLALQCHPEKSGTSGLRLLKSFLRNNAVH